MGSDDVIEHPLLLGETIDQAGNGDRVGGWYAIAGAELES